MNNNILIIQLKPNYNSTAESLGYNLEVDELDNNAILFQQGYDIDEIEVEPGERFQISSDYEGSVSCEEVKYKLVKYDLNNRKVATDYDDILKLESGRYLFHNDGITIEKISDN